MIFTDPQLQQCYGSNFAEGVDLSNELRQVRRWWRFTTSSRCLKDHTLRESTKRWSIYSGRNCDPVSVPGSSARTPGAVPPPLRYETI
jgi:hypothetical protein